MAKRKDAETALRHPKKAKTDTGIEHVAFLKESGKDSEAAVPLQKKPKTVKNTKKTKHEAASTKIQLDASKDIQTDNDAEYLEEPKSKTVKNTKGEVVTANPTDKPKESITEFQSSQNDSKNKLKADAKLKSTSKKSKKEKKHKKSSAADTEFKSKKEKKIKAQDPSCDFKSDVEHQVKKSKSQPSDPKESGMNSSPTIQAKQVSPQKIAWNDWNAAAFNGDADRKSVF